MTACNHGLLAIGQELNRSSLVSGLRSGRGQTDHSFAELAALCIGDAQQHGALSGVGAGTHGQLHTQLGNNEPLDCLRGFLVADVNVDGDNTTAGSQQHIQALVRTPPVLIEGGALTCRPPLERVHDSIWGDVAGRFL
ncbi:hypothetical protein [Hydrogenophaga sp.]|uniref:hypothetical protein n=1 Tax=Hydrogenophaga sp. TaxID=1904254 RepID=UPI0035B2EB91